MYNVEPKINQKLYRYGTYRNLFRVGYENNFNISKWQDFISVCKKDKVINELQSQRTINSMKRTYSYMVDQVAEQMGLELKKIERTPSQTKLVLDTSSAPITMYD